MNLKPIEYLNVRNFNINKNLIIKLYIIVVKREDKKKNTNFFKKQTTSSGNNEIPNFLKSAIQQHASKKDSYIKSNTLLKN